MPHFILLRIQRDELPGDPLHETPAQVAVKFFPLRAPGGDYMQIEAPSPEAAFARIPARLSPFRHSLAVTEYNEYLATAERLSAARESARDKPRLPRR